MGKAALNFKKLKMFNFLVKNYKFVIICGSLAYRSKEIGTSQFHGSIAVMRSVFMKFYKGIFSQNFLLLAVLKKE